MNKSELIEALAEARLCSDPSFLIRILYYLGSELAIQGRGAECEPYFDEAIALSHQLDSLKMEGLTRWQRLKARISLRSLGGYSVRDLFKR